MTAQRVGAMPLSGALPTTYPDPDPDPDPLFELKHSPESLQPRKSGNGRGEREKRKGVEWIEKGQGKGREGQRIREGKAYRKAYRTRPHRRHGSASEDQVASVANKQIYLF